MTSPDPTPSPTPKERTIHEAINRASPDPQAAVSPLEIAEQGVDESVSRFISRLHEQIRTLTQQRDRYAAALRRARTELNRWGHGDFRFGDMPRDPKVLAALADIDAGPRGEP